MSGGDGDDTIQFTGRPDQIQYDVHLGASWQSTTTYLSFPGVPNNEATDTVESITFTDSTISNAVNPYFGNPITEMAKLSLEAYDNGTAFGAQSAGIAKAIGRGWRPVSAMELGILPSNFIDPSKTKYGYYEFINGVFTVVTAGSQLGQVSPDTGYAHGKVEVLVGVVNNKPTLTLAFTGTDEPADPRTYDFARNYESFAPLIDALKDYISVFEIQQVLITGHSMGAALVQTALGQDFAATGVNVEAFTFASPGSNADAPAADITNFDRVGDPVPWIGSIFDSIDGSVITMSTGGGWNNPLDPTFDHSMILYLSDLQGLIGLAEDTSNVGFYGRALAQVLRAGDLWNLGSIRVNFGTPGGDNLIGVTEDHYILGGAGNDRIKIDPSVASSRMVDGGAGDNDQVIFSAAGSYTKTPIANGFEISRNGVSIGQYYGVDHFFSRDGLLFEPGAAVQQLPAHAPSLGKSSETPITFTLLPGYIAADAGDGAMTVIGTSGDDVIYAGLGNKTINGGDGNDLIIIRDKGSAAAADIITIDGGAGADMMLGGRGSETYIVDNVGDAIQDIAGMDQVLSSVSYVLPDKVENLTLQEAAIGATGNALANIIYGNANDNVIDGAGSADAMAGGAGNDTYFVDSNGDTVTENAHEGTDLVYSLASFTLSANIENLTLTGSSSRSATGNNLSNIIIGNDGSNAINGGGGADTMTGGLGNDTYYVDNAGDVVTEGASAGTDLVHSTISCTLGANLENLTLSGLAANGTGNELANQIRGTNSANILDGAAGNDLLVGNGGDDTLSGGAGNDTINGGAGSDNMAGGTGDDIYYVDALTDIVTENSGEGTADKVISSIDYTLGADIERLLLYGSNPIDGTGNGLANVLYGNSAANVMDGAAGADTLFAYAGNDTLVGGSGRDTMVGGAGSDTFIFQDDDFGGTTASTADRITDFISGQDKIDLSAVDANLSLAND